jgi:YegS/Rv2252/BmrU family lipid kinase
MRIGVVINPRAGGGRMAAAWPTLQASLESKLGPVEALFTSRQGEGSELARRLSDGGVDSILAAGGDGTIGEVVDGIMRSSRRPELGIIPVGTGIDFPRNLETGRSPQAAIEAIASGRKRALDVGRVTFTAEAGVESTRHFLNEASFGLSGSIVRAVNGSKTGKPTDKLVFLWHSVDALIRLKPQRVSIVLDDGAPIEEEVAVVAVCNGRYFGAGLMVAPDASIDDGLFDVVIVKHANAFALIGVLLSAYRGGHVKSPLCTVTRAKRVEVQSLGEPSLVDIDGESPGTIPARVEMLAGALTLRG